jgi:hypothetical protein
MLQSVSADVAKRRLGTFNPDKLHGYEHVQHMLVPNFLTVVAGLRPEQVGGMLIL